MVADQDAPKNQDQTESNRFESAIDFRLKPCELLSVASLGVELSSNRLSVFSGTEKAENFGIWLRKFNDVLRIKETALTQQEKANV